MAKRNRNAQWKAGGRNKGMIPMEICLHDGVADPWNHQDAKRLKVVLPTDQMWELMQYQFSSYVAKLGNDNGDVYHLYTKTIDGYFYIEDSMLDSLKEEFIKIAKTKPSETNGEALVLDFMKRISTTCIVRPIE